MFMGRSRFPRQTSVEWSDTGLTPTTWSSTLPASQSAVMVPAVVVPRYARG